MTEDNPEQVVPRAEVMRMSVDIVAAYVGQNIVLPAQVPDVINRVFAAMVGLTAGAGSGAEETRKPAVSIRRSVTPDYLVCLEDGRRLKMLKRHLRTAYNLTPEEYRSRWGLPADYPMVAPNYAKRRSEFAKKIGLGRKAV